MPPRDWSLRVRDMVSAIDDIRGYVQGMDSDAFEASRRTVDAVLYRLTIIGEAAGHVPEEVRLRHPHINWRQLRETRNIVTHVYFGVDLPRIWRLASQRLPAVRDQLLHMLAVEGEQPPTDR